VCALYRAGVEIPSDYAGVLYVELDDRGAWKLELAKELKAANLPVDMNRAL
jgi:predicted nucleotide-binding protein